MAMNREEFNAMDMADKAKAWQRMTPAERDACRDESDLSPQLRGLEGWRVQVADPDAPKGWRRFIVGKSTGWRPCHLEIARQSSSGGYPAAKHYDQLSRLEKVR